MERVKPEIHNTVKERIKPLITKAGNVSAFARSIGVSRDAVNNWLFDKSDFRLNDLVKISQEYNVSVDYLLGFAESPTREGTKQAAEEYTGLSADAVEILHSKKLETHSDDDHDRIHAQVFLTDISELIENDAFQQMIQNVDYLRLCYNKSVDSINYLIDFCEQTEEIDASGFDDALSDLFEYFPSLRMQLFELSEMWSDSLEALFPTKELIIDGKELMRRFQGEV